MAVPAELVFGDDAAPEPAASRSGLVFAFVTRALLLLGATRE
jgi:hypothetical protein